MAGKSGAMVRFPDPEMRIDWMQTADAHASGVGEWDVKSEQLVDAILQVLASGSAIMFGRTSDGGAVSVTIYSGNEKQRKYVSDSIELDDWAAATIQIASRLHIGRFASGSTSGKK